MRSVTARSMERPWRSSGDWDRPQSPEDLHGRSIDLAVTLRKTTYLGTAYPELRVVDLRESGV